ncbi:hypothetical protein PG996_006961 [Apiospora saccharicola]|uniref:Uncharacterized protein n=1 Tax=Apiospora saccharicola TaxID=335842 RepID=A0ABR1VCU8_9PEZI
MLRPFDDTDDAPVDSATDSPIILDSPRSVRSRPIAIELPVPKKITSSSSSVYTPPAPLSARGDVPGAYFPFHEEQNRVYHGHPFHLDASKARQRSIQKASQSRSPEQQSESAPTVPRRAPPPATVPMPSTRPDSPYPAPPATVSMSSANTPVASYIPSGVHANPLPMGKYYPSNYEKRKEDKRMQQPPRPMAANTQSMSVKSDTQVPMYRPDTTSPMGHSRNESEAKRRLQQYQRDMIAQATLALNGGNVNAAALNAIQLRNMGFTSVTKPNKPNKPRLEPLGSPGPVTPMELESADDGYIGARVASSGDSAQIEEIARAIREDEERKRREGASSPAVELSS